MTKVSQSADNELRKLSASFLSSLGVAVVAAGVLAPGLSLLSENPFISKNSFLVVGAGCVVLAFFLHFLGRGIVRKIQ